MPSQPSISKNISLTDVPFYYDQAFYQTNAFNSNDMVTVSMAGTIRGVKMAQMSLAPFRYNPVTNVLKVYNDIVFEIVFNHPDVVLTEQMKSKYYSPYFESSLNSMINHTQPAAKDALTKYPVKYVIISLTTFQQALQPFVYWKRQKGFNVIEQYYSSAPTTATVKTYLQGLYDAGTPADPAPTFVLLVGDVAQIPTYTGVADNAHKTDLYFCTLDGSGDYIPDMYYGRFSATTTTHVTNQVNKTLLYEKYLMPTATYMDTVVMVAGYDSYGNDATYGNGQINYGTTNYFNASHGIYSYTYLDPNNTEAIAGAAMRANLYKGVGYANYTAHCSSSGWATPAFSTSQIASMYNNNKYGLLVGNCCQSNTFYDPECFGEALLRAYANKGAVGYIGASDYSYWDEDYYWGVGARSSISANPTYSASALGSYDCIFHDKGQPKTSWYYTNDQMRYAGLLAVQQSSSTMKQYYWEEYHLMGDPSVMNYFSVPDPMTVTYTSPQNAGVSSLVVNTVEDAYVAISHAGVLLDAELAPVGGVTTLNFSPINQADTLDVVVTKQNKQPYIGTLIVVNASIPLDAELVSINSPDVSYNCGGISVVPQVTVRNAGTTTLTSFRLTYQITGGSQQIYNWSGSLASNQTVNINLPAITLPSVSFTFSAATSLPNGSADQNPSNDSKTKAITVNNFVVSADFSGNQTTSCNAPLSVVFTNSSSNATSYLWDFGDGSTSTDASPTHNYTSLGTYTVVLTASAGVCGSDTETKTAYITVGSDAPVGTNASRCGAGSVILNVSGSGTLNWYDALSGGNLLTTGTAYVTPNLTATTSYFVESVIPGTTSYTGLTNVILANTSNINAEQGLVFTAIQPFVLKSVKVRSLSTSASSKTVTLKNSSGTTLSTVTVNNVPTGESRITLNINVPVGTNLRLTAPANSYLQRDNSVPTGTYPITLPGVVSITTTTASANPQIYYYYFYDWEVQTLSCSSSRTEVIATVNTPPVASFSSAVVAATADFTNTSTGATSFYWNFGDGSTSTATSPSHTYASDGTFNVMLIANNGLCSDTVYQNVTIITIPTRFTISGHTLYANKVNAGNPAPNPPTFNAAKYRIDRVVVVLKNYPAGTELARDTSDASGAFQLNNVLNGTYLLSYDKYTPDTMLWGNEANVIDLTLTKYLISSDTLMDPSRSFTAKYKRAIDVDNNSSINAIDVSRLKAKIGSPSLTVKNFPAGNWVALDTLVTVAGSDLNVDLKTICYGDYDASSSKYRDSATTWGSAKSFSENIIIGSDESIITGNSGYFEIPLRISAKINDFSAMGLELNYPADEYKLTTASLPQTGSGNTVKINPSLEEIIADDNDLLVTDEKGIIRIVFATTRHFDVAANDEVIRLGFHPLRALDEGELDFQLSGTGILADQYGVENEGAYLLMPKIFIQGDNPDTEFGFSGYPNPINGNAVITYSLPESGTVKLSVYNTTGEKVSELVNGSQRAGVHAAVFSPDGLAQGIYTFRLEFYGAERSECLVLKMIY